MEKSSRIFNSCFDNIHLYVSDSWTLDEKIMEHLQPSEYKEATYGCVETTKTRKIVTIIKEINLKIIVQTLEDDQSNIARRIQGDK